MLKNENNLNNDFGELTENKLDFGLWLSENRQKIIKSITIFLIVVCATMFIYAGYNLYIYFSSSNPDDQLAVNSGVMSPRNVASNLEVGETQIIASGEKYDLSVKIHNPNDKFIGNFKYCFVQNGQDLSCDDSFILPGSNKYVLVLSQKLDGQPKISFDIRSIFWTRINAHKISNWKDYSDYRLNFIMSDVSFSANSNNSQSGQVNLNNFNFNIKNQTPYSYLALPVNILLFNGSELVGVNRYIINNLQSSEKRQINLTWSGEQSSVTRSEIIPDVNIMDDNVYIKYSGSPSN